MARAAGIYRKLQEQQSRAVENHLADYANSRILVVEDSSVVLALISRFLTHYGLRQIRSAENGQAALQIMMEWQPDLILTDLHMPVMDGFELCRRIRSDGSLSDIPILVLTGLEKLEERIKVFEAGATDLIGKPVYHLELAGRLHVHLERSHLIKRLKEYKERVADEIDLARSMQVDLLPGEDLIRSVIDSMPVELASHYEASIGLGGDLWGLRKLGPDQLFVYLLDFSGHGVGSALNTFRFQGFFNSCDAIDVPSMFLAELNGFLHEILPVGQFATMFCATIDFKSRRMTFSSAGAPPALLKTGGGNGGFVTLDGTGFPLGLRCNSDYTDQSLDFMEGSRLFLYSDALIETPDPPDSIFDYDGLAGFLSALPEETSCKTYIDAVLARLTCGEAKAFSDDVTIVCVEFSNDFTGSN
jgi:sigma-B regulation protein RsbU (phosphoserine phosphatase)